MVKKAKGKVVPLPPQDTQLRFPEGDLRNSMTDEEITRYAALEEAEINRELSRYMIANPLPGGGAEAEEEESFTVDLANNKVEQKLGEGVLIRGDGLNGDLVSMTASLKPLFVETPDGPYTKLITDIFVRKAIGSLVIKLNTYYSDLEDQISKSPILSINDGLNKELEEVYRKKNTLRNVIMSNKVNYELIPEWAVGHINGFIEDRITQLVILTDD